MKRRIAIIGKGRVGSALQRGLEKAGYETKMTGKGGAARQAAAWGEVVVLAVPFLALDAVAVELAGALGGKTVVDVTNALTADMRLAVGFTTSGAEELQKKLPASKVVKAFNAVFAANMSNGTVKNTKIACFAAGDDAQAKADVLEMAGAIGFDPIDAGPLANARLLEPLGYLNIQLGFVVNKGLGTAIGLSLVR